MCILLSPLHNYFLKSPSECNMAGRLSDDHMDQLESFIGTGPKTFRLLYSFTRDGCGPQPFHSKCDNQGPTVTVVYNPQGSVYGGYTSLAWQNSGNWKQDDQAFLFQLVFSHQKLCRKFPSKKTTQDVFHYSSYGPLFGYGHALLLFSNNVNPVNGVFSLSTASGHMNPSEDYEYGGVKPADINNGTMDVVEGEVYSVTGTCMWLIRIRCKSGICMCQLFLCLNEDAFKNNIKKLFKRNKLCYDLLLNKNT